MDLLDVFLAVSTGAVVIAALLFPVNRDDEGDDGKSASENAPERVSEDPVPSKKKKE